MTLNFDHEDLQCKPKTTDSETSFNLDLTLKYGELILEVILKAFRKQIRQMKFDSENLKL